MTAKVMHAKNGEWEEHRERKPLDRDEDEPDHLNHTQFLLHFQNRRANYRVRTLKTRKKRRR